MLSGAVSADGIFIDLVNEPATPYASEYLSKY